MQFVYLPNEDRKLNQGRHHLGKRIHFLVLHKLEQILVVLGRHEHISFPACLLNLLLNLLQNTNIGKRLCVTMFWTSVSGKPAPIPTISRIALLSAAFQFPENFQKDPLKPENVSKRPSFITPKTVGGSEPSHIILVSFNISFSLLGTIQSNQEKLVT